MVEKRARRRMFLMICALIVLPSALIFAWTIIRSKAKHDTSALSSESPASKDTVSRAFSGGAARFPREMGLPAIDNSKRSDAAAGSGSEGRDEASEFPEGIPEQAPFPAINPPLGLRLAGTLIGMGKSARAILIELDTGRQGLYREGDSIIGATILKIAPESVVLEKNGAFQVLGIAKSEINKNPIASSAVGSDPATGVSGRVPNFDSVETAGGPPVDENAETRELPFFQPFTNSTGPPVDENVETKELPFFQPFTNSTGPPVDPRGNYEDLPEFTPYSSEKGPE